MIHRTFSIPSSRASVATILAGCVLIAGCGKMATNPEAAAAPPSKSASDGGITLPANSPKLRLIRVAPVSMGDFELAEVTAPGEVVGNPNRISHVLTPVTGRIQEVLVHLGDTVTEGQSLAIVESPDATAVLAAEVQTEAQVRQAQSAVLKSERDLARVRELHEHGVAPLKEVQAAENDSVQAQANLDQAQAAVKSATQRVTTLGLEPGQLSPIVRLRAPIGGKVTEIAVAPGEYWDDNSASLMTIIDLRTVWISALVPEIKIAYITLGEAVSAEFEAYQGEVFHARVMRIADNVDPQTRTIRVEAEIPNPAGRLRPAMFGQFHHFHEPARKPAAPVSAVVSENGRSVVYVEERPGTFCERTVTTGERKNDMLPVLSGLSAGERIVVDGVMLLRTEEAAR
jgi:membrane fusion protein, heavy metal efflux system